MNIIDLFSGLESFSKAFKDRGHNVFTVDINPKFNPSLVADIMDLKANNFPFKPDVVLASPPCNCFSVASVYRHWKNGKPANSETKKAIKLLKHTLKLIESLNPRWWVLENPRGMLRKVLGKPDYFITQCQYGREVMKPTDLWGCLPKSFIPKSCKNRDLCHQSSPRGSKYGTQGINLKAFKKNRFSYMVKGGGNNSSLRAKIPYGLSMAICLTCEKSLDSNEIGVSE